MSREPRPVAGWPRLVLRVAGGGLLIASAAIHFDLYLTGFSNIPTIGWLFLFQVITGFVLGIAVLVYGSRLAAAAGAGFALATLGGYVLSLWVGLFGFKETRTTAGIVAGVIEVAAAATLGMLALTPAPGGRHEAGAGRGIGARLRAGLPHAGWLVTGASILALALLGGTVATAGSVPTYASAGSGLKAAQVGGATVLVNAKGFTLYWFAIDTPTKSHCEGTCAQYWLPLKGPTTLSPGVTGQLGTIKRSDGSV